MRRVGSILCIAVACALGAGGSAAGANPAPAIADGVYIGSVAVGGLTGPQAKAAVKRAYYGPLVVQVNHHVFRIKTYRFHVLADVTTAVQTALTAAAYTTVPLIPTFDPALMRKWVATLEAKTRVAPVAGTIVLRHYRPRFTHAHRGRVLRRHATRSLLRHAILAGDRVPIVAPLRRFSDRAAQSEPIIVIHRGINRLVLFHGRHWVRAFPVATGQPIYPTPLGRFAIVIKEKNPWWYPPTQDAWAQGLKPVPPGPGNPLGTRWMGLSAPGVGIHGTSEPWSIGHSESHGCIRMQVPDAEWLYRHVRVGTPVFIVR